MKKRKKIRIGLAFGLMVIFLAVCCVFNSAQAYKHQTTHPMLTEATTHLYNSLYEDDLLEEYIQEIVQGAIKEDTAPRWINHFYDPITGEGWTGERLGQIPAEAVRQLARAGISSADAVSALEWLHNPKLQDRYLYFEGNKTFERAVYDYVNGDKKEAYRSLGHILHLLQDMAVPAHTRQDTHADVGGDEGEPYEEWVSENGNLNHLDYSRLDKSFNCQSIDDCLRELAKYSNKNFFSEGTILDNSYRLPITNKKEKRGRYDIFYSVDDYPIAILDHIDNRYTTNDNLIHQSYWERLSEKAVVSGVEVIRLFHEYVAEAQNNPDMVQEPPVSSAAFFQILSTGFYNIISAPNVDPPIFSALGHLSKIKDWAKNLISLFNDDSKTFHANIADLNQLNLKTAINNINTNNDIKPENISNKQENTQIAIEPNQKINNQPEQIISENITIETVIDNLDVALTSSAIESQKSQNVAEPIVEPAKDSKQNIDNQLPPTPPMGFNFYIGGGAPAALLSEQEPDLEPVFMSAPTILTTDDQILGPDDDSATSTDGFQIEITGTSSPSLSIVVSVMSISSSTETNYITVASTTNNWSQTVTLTSGNNTIAVKAMDVNNNESAEVYINLFLDDLSPVSIADLSVVFGDSRDEAVLSWTIPNDVGSNENVNQYILKHSTTSPITEDNWDNTATTNNFLIPSASLGIESFNVDNLEIGLMHYFSVKSVDVFGNVSSVSNCTSIWLSPIADNIVISELSAADMRIIGDRAKDEFIELYNPTEETINLSGWSLQYAAAQATSTWRYKYFKIGDVVDSVLPNIDMLPHSYYLITSATSSNFYSRGMQSDLSVVTSEGNPTYLGLASDGGKVRLINSDDDIVDLVAWGNDSLGAEGMPVNVDGFSWGSLERKFDSNSTAELLAINGEQHWNGNDQDTNNNSNDFVLQNTPNPQNLLSLTEPRDEFYGLAETDWPMFGYDYARTGKSSYAGITNGNPTSTPKWVVALGGSVDSLSMMIGLDSFIYAGTNEGEVYKISRENGDYELFYSTGFNREIKTPAISSDGTVYVSDDCALYALTSAGQLKWKSDNFGGVSTPTIDSNGNIYVSSEYRLYAFNSNGEMLWQTEQIANGVYVSDVAMDSHNNLYVAGRKGLYSDLYKINRDTGEIITFKDANLFHNMYISLDSNDNLYMSVYLYRQLVLFDSDLEQLQTITGLYGRPLLGLIAIDNDNDVSYVMSEDGYISQISNITREISWQKYIGGDCLSSATIDDNGIIYVGNDNNMFYAINIDGTIRWLAELDDRVIFSAIIDSDGTIYVSSDSGMLYAFGD